MTAKQLVDRLKYLESEKTFYKAKFPYNLLYVNGANKSPNPYSVTAISGDCVNLYKALLNGYDVSNHSVGYYQSTLGNTGDVTEWGLLEQCTDISQDFSKLKNGEPRLLYMDGHIGGYVGDFQKYGKTYNVVECTSSWGGGILFSYVDSKGGRYKSKGGEKRKAWTHHGLMTPWVDYSQKIDTIPDTDMKPITPTNPEEPTPTKPIPKTHEGSTVAHYFDSKKYSRAFKVNASGGLNVRSGVGTSTISKGVLPFGSMVNCYGYYDYDSAGDVWLYCSTKYGSGFCKAEFLS
jgi:hypothetical protein